MADSNDGKDYTDVGIRAGHPSAPVHSEEGIANPQGRFAGDLAIKHESSELGSFRPIFNTAIAVLLMAVVCYLVLFFMFKYWGASEVKNDRSDIPVARDYKVEVPNPRLVEGPDADDLKNLKGTAARNVVSYGWADQAAGRARIPAERAIDIVAAKGLPTGPEWELKPGEAIIQGVIRPASELNQPAAAGAVTAPTNNAPGSAVPGQPNTGAGQPATAPGGSPTANPAGRTMSMGHGFAGPSQTNADMPNRMNAQENP